MKRRGWDSNPRALADKRFSRPPRYDHFDTPARERVMGIEPTYPAWKAGVLPLNYTRIFNCSQVGVTGFEPATSWSQTRRSSQAEPHPDIVLCFCLIRKTRVIILQAKGKVNTFFYFFYFFFFWCLTYLYPGFIHCRRCSLGNWCICTALIFASTDTLFLANVSTTCSSLNL